MKQEKKRKLEARGNRRAVNKNVKVPFDTCISFSQKKKMESQRKSNGYKNQNRDILGAMLPLRFVYSTLCKRKRTVNE
jgi:hypothetical protein